MIVPSGFSSWQSYFQFAFAREFITMDTGESLGIKKNSLEKVGEVVSRPFLRPLDFLLREIKNPVVITAITVTLIAITTLIFYPAHFMLAVGSVLPFLVKVQPWMVKFALYIAVEVVIAAIGLRIFGRMCNTELRRLWNNNEIMPIYIGAKIEQ